MRDTFRRRWGVTFQTDTGTYHSFRDFSLLPAAQPNFGTAPPDVTLLKIPGANGRLDISRALTGYMLYDNRTPTLQYYIPGRESQRHARLSRLMNALHGQTARIIPDEAPDGYWYGLLQVSEPQQTEAAWLVTVSGSLEPYKHDFSTTEEPWLWDSFSFEIGVIREYGAIQVDGTTTVTVVSSPMGGSPTFRASAAMTMTYGGGTYNLAAGANVFPTIELPHGVAEVAFTFTGTGTVSIAFQTGRL